jgi:hypothetical protein
VILAGVAIASVLFFTRGGSGVDPLTRYASDGIPSRVARLEVERMSALLPSADAPPVFLDSALAEVLCGGADLAGELFAARSLTLEELESRGTLDLLSRPDLRARLTCGQHLRAALASEHLGFVTFQEDGADRQVLMVPGHFEELPFGPHRFSGLQGFCEQGSSPGECDAGGSAAVRREDRWVFGEAPSVEAYAREWASTKRTDSTHVEIARALLEALEGADRVKVQVRPTAVPLGSACGSIAPSSLALGILSQCFPGDLQQVEESINARTRGFAYEADEPARLGRIRLVYTFLARDEEAAEELERDVADFHRDWLSHVENHEAQLVRTVRESNLTYKDHWETRIHGFVRALGEARLERDGAVVRLRMESALSEEERRALEVGSPDEDEALAAVQAVVEAVASNDPVPHDALARLVGAEVATWMTHPRARAEDCGALRDRLATLVGAGVAPDLFGVKFRLEQRFADEACVGSVLPRALHDCVVQAESLEAMDACPAPASPFTAHHRAELQGQWVLESVDAAPGFSYAQRRTLERTKLEVADDRVAFYLGEVYLGPLDLASSGTSSARIRLPLGERPVEATLTVTGEDQIHLAGLGGLELTLRKGTFERSLFALAADSEGDR